MSRPDRGAPLARTQADGIALCGGAMISESQMILSGLLTRLEPGPASLPGDGPAATTRRRAADAARRCPAAA